MRHTTRAATAALMATLVLLPAGNPSGAAAQVATPAVTYSCEAVPTASPVAGMHGMAMGTPTAAMDYAAVALDQAYIDMMIPHHQSIIPVAEAALPRLTDERLRDIAQAVVATQQPEIEELRGYREQWYGSAEPMPMDEAMMAAMVELLPGMSGTMEEMAFQMDAPAQVAAFCAAENPDLAFIDQTIPHHQMAIEASEVALEQATHPEVRDVAQRVIDAQQREIETLTEIRSEIAVSATPSSS